MAGIGVLFCEAVQVKQISIGWFALTWLVSIIGSAIQYSILRDPFYCLDLFSGVIVVSLRNPHMHSRRTCETVHVKPCSWARTKSWGRRVWSQLSCNALSQQAWFWVVKFWVNSLNSCQLWQCNPRLAMCYPCSRAHTLYCYAKSATTTGWHVTAIYKIDLCTKHTLSHVHNYYINSLTTTRVQCIHTQ